MVPIVITIINSVGMFSIYFKEIPDIFYSTNKIVMTLNTNKTYRNGNFHSNYFLLIKSTTDSHTETVRYLPSAFS